MSVSAPSQTTPSEMIQLKLKGANAFQDALTTGQHYAASLRNADNVMAPVLMACAIAEMRERLTDDAMSVVAQLAGSSLGFRTDQQYPPAKLKDIVISAILNEVNIVGNEFNVVAGEFYIAKNGWKRKLKNAGFSRVDPSIGRPEDIREGSPNQKGTKKISAMFCASASCQKDGETFQVTATRTDEADYRIEVDGYGSSLMDVQTQLRGKAEARILRKLWFYVADEPDCDTDEPEGSVIVIEADNTQPAAAAKTTTPPAGCSTEPDFVAEWKAIASRVGQDHPVIRLARLLASAKTLGTIEALSAEEQSLYASGAIQTREHDPFRRYVQHCSSLFPEL